MRPIATEKEGRGEKLVHQCLRCGKIRKNKVQAEDDFEALLALAREQAKKL